MTDLRDLSAPELNRFIADELDRALSLPDRARREHEGWRLSTVSAEPDGTGLWLTFGHTDDPDSYAELRFEQVPDTDGQLEAPRRDADCA